MCPYCALKKFHKHILSCLIKWTPTKMACNILLQEVTAVEATILYYFFASTIKLRCNTQ